MATTLVAAAGEHFVAYRLSAMGYPVALTRGGSPTVDLMVGDLAGHAAISLQVKTSSQALRQFARKPENNRWEWDIGQRAVTLRGKSIFYAFVDLKGDHRAPGVSPDIFIVPSLVVADKTKDMNPRRLMFWIMYSDKDQYMEAWQYIFKQIQEGAANEQV